MNKIDIKNWKEFKIIEIFTVKNTHSILQHSVKRNGKTPYVTASHENNSVVDYVDYDITQIDKGGCIFIGGKTLVVSYQELEFFSNDSHNLALYPKTDKPLTKYAALFLVSVIQKSLGRIYSWGDSISYKAIQKDVIQLPCKNNQPDYEYMENFIKLREKKVGNSLKNALTVQNITSLRIDNKNWKEFHIYDFFLIDSGNKMDKVKMDFSNPEINFIGRANANNGVTSKVGKVQDIEPYKAGYLTLALGGEYLGSCFIQRQDFYTSQNVNVLIPLFEMSNNVKEFIATSIFKESRLHYKAFVRELNKYVRKTFVFKLPVDKDGNADYKYMDCYMSNIVNKISRNLEVLRKI